jgi:hypothetical protein
MTDTAERAAAPQDVPSAVIAAFGVSFAIADDIPLPELLGRPPSPGAAWTWVREDPGGVEEHWDAATAHRVREQRRGQRVVMSIDYEPVQGYLLRCPGLGTALVTPDGLEILWAREAPPAEWSALLVGQVLPLAATLRGLEVFHAAGLVLDGQAHMLCGAAGTGKTSLAAHLVLGGADLLSDDVVALDDRLMAHPGTAVLRLREPEAGRVKSAPTSRLGARKEADGRVRIAATAAVEARPLSSLYLLERAAEGAGIEPLHHPKPTELLGSTFNLSVQTPSRLIRQLDLCARIAREVPIFRVRVRPDQDAAELASELAAHVRAHLRERQA